MRESENFSNNYVRKFKSIWMEFGVLLRLVGLMKHLFILSLLITIQEREPYLCDFAEKKILC